MGSLTKKKCETCEGTQVLIEKDGTGKPCPALTVTALGRLACKLPDGTFDVKAENRSVLNARMQKDKAYEERNRVVLALAKAVTKLGGRAGRLKTKIPGWNPEWDWCIQIDTPTGQSWRWHYHVDHLPLFEWLPIVNWEWNNVDTPTKYKQMEEWKP